MSDKPIITPFFLQPQGEPEPPKVTVEIKPWNPGVQQAPSKPEPINYDDFQPGTFVENQLRAAAILKSTDKQDPIIALVQNVVDFAFPKEEQTGLRIDVYEILITEILRARKLAMELDALKNRTGASEALRSQGEPEAPKGAEES